MDLSAVSEDLSEVSVLLNVAHRLLLTVRDDVEASPSLQGLLDTLNSAHDQLDVAMETIGSALDQVEGDNGGQPHEQRPAIH